MLAAFSLVCALGVRYPLQMLPVLLWELLWKGLWLATIALRWWLGDGMDEGTTGFFLSCVPIGCSRSPCRGATCSTATSGSARTAGAERSGLHKLSRFSRLPPCTERLRWGLVSSASLGWLEPFGPACRLKGFFC